MNSAPPDTNGDVGPNHYVQIVNTDLAIFNKSGTVVYGPVPINTLWSGFGGLCQTDNDGDPVAVYDSIADRFVIGQLAVTGTTTGFLYCVAVSTTPDPTGSYYRYSFSYGSSFPDYPKLSIWPDAIYATFNMFDAAGTTFQGGQVCAFDRTSMLTGRAATQQCFNVGTSFGGLLAASLEGSRLPPAGSPDYVVSLGAANGQLATWKFHVDWASPANTTLTGPSTLTTAPFTLPCNNAAGACVPQRETTQRLDTLGDRLMYRLAYRNFGNYESLVANHSVTAGSSVGIRWYELRPSAGTLSIFQQGTYAPDTSFRWMGSIAQDQAGNIALGFSVSSSLLRPEIHYTGRLSTDPAGTMSQGEGTIINGAGSQTGGLNRWGDYSGIAIDPSDDCTFWYTNEYIPTSGAFNWKTRVGTFKFPNCAPSQAPDFTISANPTSLSVQQASSGTSTISTAQVGGAGTVGLSAAGAPSGTTATLNPSSVAAGGSSTLTLSVGSTTPLGSYTITVSGSEGANTHSTTVTLTVTAPPPSPLVNGDFEAGNFTGWTTMGTAAVGTSPPPHGGTYSAVVGGTSATNGDSTISQTFTAPSAGGTLSFWYKVHCPDSLEHDWALATLTDVTAGTTRTVLPKTCNNSNVWVSVSALLVGNHTYTLGLTSHDNNNPADPTYTQFDDVAIGAAPPPLANGDFELGNLSGWTSAGVTAITTTSRSGAYAAQVGSKSPFSGDSSITQTFTAPSGSTTLRFWYQVVCTDTVTYDWATATLQDITTNVTTTVLQRTCTNNGVWVQISVPIVAGHIYKLVLTDHDDNYPTDPTYTLFDDVSVQ